MSVEVQRGPGVQRETEPSRPPGRRRLRRLRRLTGLTVFQEQVLIEHMQRRQQEVPPEFLVRFREDKSGHTVRVVKPSSGISRIGISDPHFNIVAGTDSGSSPDKEREFTTNGGLFEKHVANYIVPQMTEENRQALMDHIANGGRVVYSSYQKVPKQFADWFKRYTQEHHGGADLMARVMAITESSIVRQENGNGSGHSSDNTADDGRPTLKKLLEEPSVRNAIHFTALPTKGNDLIPPEVKRAVQELNKHIVPYGFYYLMELVKRQKSIKDFATAAGFSAFGLAFGLGLLGLDRLGASHAYAGIQSDVFNTTIEAGEKAYKGLEQGSSSFTGEVVALEVNMAGASNGSQKERPRRWTTARAETIMNKSNAQQADDTIEIEAKRKAFIDKLPPWIAKRLPRYSAMIPGLTIAVGLTTLSVATGNIWTFLAVAPTNRLLYTAVEVHQRRKHFKKQHVVADKQEKHRDTIDYLSAQKGWVNNKLAKLAEKNPALALAIKDFSENKVGAFSLLGTLLSVPVLGVAAPLFELKRQIVYALSGIVFENGVGALGGINSVRRKPLEQLERSLPALREIEKIQGKRYKENHPDTEY